MKSQLGEDGQIQISIHDTWPGLPLGKADHIFDAFFTTKPQGRRHGPGNQQVDRRIAWRPDLGQRRSSYLALLSTAFPKHTTQLTADSGCGRRAINRDVALSLLTEGDKAEQESQRPVFYVLQANSSEPLGRAILTTKMWRAAEDSNVATTRV